MAIKKGDYCIVVKQPNCKLKKEGIRLCPFCIGNVGTWGTKRSRYYDDESFEFLIMQENHYTRCGGVKKMYLKKITKEEADKRLMILNL